MEATFPAGAGRRVSMALYCGSRAGEVLTASTVPFRIKNTHTSITSSLLPPPELFSGKQALLPLPVKLQMEGEFRQGRSEASAFQPCERGNPGFLSVFKASPLLNGCIIDSNAGYYSRNTRSLPMTLCRQEPKQGKPSHYHLMFQ